MRGAGAFGCVVVAALLAACGSAPPIPAERYYRLPPPAARHRLTPPPRLERVEAPGPLRERPLLYSDDERGLVLQQQHYHAWLAPPPELVRRHLQACLGADVAVDPASDGAGGWRLRVRLERFERVLAGDRASVAVVVAVSARNGEQRLVRRYAHLLPVDGPGVAAAVPVFAAALDTTCGELAADLAGDSIARR